MSDDMYHACRWCHWFDNGKCCKGIVDIDRSLPVVPVVYDVSESGALSGTLEESLGSANRAEFKRRLREELLKLKPSQKKFKEFFQVFDECMEQFLDLDVKPLLDNDISMLYQNRIEGTVNATSASAEVVIKEPADFCCKYFE